MPVIDTQLGTSGQLLVDRILLYKPDLTDGRATQPSFEQPAGSEIYAVGQLTEAGRENTELRCTRLAPVLAGTSGLGENPQAVSQANLEKDRLHYLESLGDDIRSSTCFPTEGKGIWETAILAGKSM